MSIFLQKTKALLIPLLSFLISFLGIVFLVKTNIGGVYVESGIFHVLIILATTLFSFYVSYKLYGSYIKSKNTETFVLGVSFYIFSVFFLFHSLSLNIFYFFSSDIFDITGHYGLFFGSLLLLVLLLPLKITSAGVFKNRKKIFLFINVGIFLFISFAVLSPTFRYFILEYINQVNLITALLLFILTVFLSVSFVSRPGIFNSKFLIVGFSVLLSASIATFFYEEFTIAWLYFHILLFTAFLFIAIDLVFGRKKTLQFKGIFLQVSLATKLMFGFGAIAILFFSMMLSLGLKISSDTIIRTTLDIVEGQTRNHAIKAESFIRDTKSDVLFIASLPMLREGLVEEGEYDRLKNIFSGIMRSKKIYSQLRYIDQNGKELVRVDYINGEAVVVSDEDLQDKSSSYYFSDTIKKDFGDVYVSEFDLNREGPNKELSSPYLPVLRYATPVVSYSGEKRGIVIANTFGDNLLKDVEKIHKNGYGSIFIVDNEGFYILNEDRSKEWGGPNNLNTGENIKNDFPEMAQHILSGDSFPMMAGDNIISRNPIFLDNTEKDRFIVVGMIIPKSIVLSDLVDFRSKVIIVMFFILFIFVSFAYFLVRRVTNPITELSIVSEKISKGDFSQRARTDTQDEVGVLSKSFNLMIDSLVYANKNLENKVKERTKDLNKKVKEVNFQISETRKFKEAIIAVTDNIVITDKDATIIYVNPAWEKTTGYKLEDVVGSNPRILQSGKTPKRVYAKMWRALSKGKPFITDEIINRKKDGSEYEEYLSVSPMKEGGKVVFYVGMSQDITKQKEVDRMKTEFVSVASHQLRTPLTAIRLFVEMLLKDNVGKLNKTQKEYLDNVGSSTKRMIALVNDLLNVSRLDTGKIVIKPEMIQMEKLIKSVVDEVKPLASEQSCKVVFKKPEKKTDKVLMDPNLMRQVIHNLLTNSIKYSSAGKKCSVVVSLKKTAREYCVAVSDTGLGIPESMQKNVFEKFFRADNAVKQETEGTGLGLYIVKKVITTMGGKVWFDSKEGKGTNFYVSFPAKGIKEKKGSKKLS